MSQVERTYSHVGEGMNSSTLYGQNILIRLQKLYMADRMGLGGTTLHYLAVWQVMVSVHRPANSKIMLTHFPYKLTTVHQGFAQGFSVLVF